VNEQMGKSLALHLVMAGFLAISGCDVLKKPTSSSTPAAENFESPYRQEIFAKELNVPWAIDIAKDGRVFLTERPGTIRVMIEGQLLKEPVLSLEAPFASQGEGGLLGLALDPHFTANHYIYVYHTYEENGEMKNRVLRLVEHNNKAKIDKVLIDNIPGSTNHNGGRIKFGPDGYLYITAGDKYEPPLAQSKESIGGKILRIRADGSIPDDNPFPGSPVYSLGHRNPQGLAWQPGSGKLFSSEHGQSAHDEFNVIEAGANYGWPEIEGDETADGMKPPIVQSGETTWAPSGIAFLTQGPWKGNLLMANLRGSQVLRFIIGEHSGQPRVSKVIPLFAGQFGRIRDVYEGPDGSIYVMTNNRDGRGKPRLHDDQIIRLVPTGVER